MSAISDNLIHFLARGAKDSPNKQLDVFKKIIATGLRTGRVQIKFSDGASVFNQIVCFTDIPLKECGEHTAIYGKFGIGFKKSYVKTVGGNPARYFLDYMPGQAAGQGGVESRGGLYLSLCQHFKLMEQLNARVAADPAASALSDRNGQEVLSAEDVATIVNVMLYIFSFDKEMGDLGPARDETREIDLYYKEREWRLVPSRLNVTSGSCQAIEGSDSFYYSFQRSDVNMVVVPNDEIRTSVLDYFLSLRGHADLRLRQFGDNPVPIINYDELHHW